MDECFKTKEKNYLCKKEYIGGINIGLKESTESTCRNVFWSKQKEVKKCLSLHRENKTKEVELMIYNEYYGKIISGLSERLKSKHKCYSMSGTSLVEIKGESFKPTYKTINGGLRYGGDAILKITGSPSGSVNNLQGEARFHAFTNFYLFLSKKTGNKYHNFKGFGPEDVKRIRVQVWDGAEMEYPFEEK